MAIFSNLGLLSSRSWVPAIYFKTAKIGLLVSSGAFLKSYEVFCVLHYYLHTKFFVYYITTFICFF